jgi:CheY-like chemotaxis protein
MRFVRATAQVRKNARCPSVSQAARQGRGWKVSEGEFRPVGQILIGPAARTFSGHQRLTPEFGADLIVTDVTMPRMNGFELAAALRRDERTRKIPLVFISSVPEDEGAARARRIGALAYVARPSDPAGMITLIVDLLARKQRADGFLAQVLKARKSTPSLSKAMPAHKQRPDLRAE